MGDAYFKRLADSRNIRVILGATVTGCLADGDRSQITRLEARTLNDKKFFVHASVFVLACGGLETPRILLLSLQDSPTTPAIATQALGRYYMNHPRTETVARLYLNRTHPAWRKVARGLVMHRSIHARGKAQFMLTIDEQMQRDESLLNSCCFFYAVSDDDVRRLRAATVAVGRDVRRGAFNKNTLRYARQSIGQLPTMLNGALHYARSQPFRVDHLVMVDQAEQVPDPQSRITLSERRDRFGQRQLKLNWRIGTETTRTLHRLHELIAARLREQNLGRLDSKILEDRNFEPTYTDCAHPIGTTRMSTTLVDGVVDRNCLVYGTRNLYVAGSAVFPTSGYANPTFTIVAFAARLAHHLAKYFEPIQA